VRCTKTPLESGSFFKRAAACNRGMLQVCLERRCRDRENGERHDSRSAESGEHCWMIDLRIFNVTSKNRFG